MINVSSWSIRNPLAAVMLFVMLTFAGIVSFLGMKVQNYPDIGLPTVIISTSLQGALPSALEMDVARKIENAIASIQGLKHVTTKIQDSAVTMTVEFRLEKSPQEAVDDVRSAVQSVRSELPADLRDPVIQKLDLASRPILAYTVSSTRLDDEALSWFIDHEISRTLLAVKGVGYVNRVGGVNRKISVSLDPLKLKALGLTAAEISQQLRIAQNESSGGKTSIGGIEQSVRTISSAKNAAEIAATELSVSRASSDFLPRIRLDQVATVKDTVGEARSVALLEGRPVVGFEVARSRGESEIAVGNAVRLALNELKQRHEHIVLTEAFDFVTPVQEEYRNSLKLLYEGALLAVIVVWIFLREWRATLISAVALPLSVIPAFAGMVLLGFSLNIVTLLALSLVIGVLVDDAIVEVENIVRHLQMGKTPYQAAMEAADEIGLAVIATTFTLIAVFLPTAFMSGIAGIFFKQFGWTAAIAVFASLVVARALTPMMAAYLLRPNISNAHVRDPRWIKIYLRMVGWCLRHRLVTLVLSVGFFVGSLALIPLLPQDFLPGDDNSQTQVTLELQPGSAMAETMVAAEQARKVVMLMPEVQSVYTTIGAGSVGGDPFSATDAAEVRRATLTIQLAPRGEREKKSIIEGRIRKELETVPAIRSKVGLGSSGEKYILVLTGDDPQTLQLAARSVERDLRTIAGLGNVSSSASLVRPEIVARLDNARATELGVTNVSIGETLRIATLGDYDAALPKLSLEQRQVPIVVRLDEAARGDLSVIERLSVPSSRGAPVMLSQVAALELTGGPAVIDRFDRARNISFEIEISDLPLGKVTKAVHELPSVRDLPLGVRIIEVGDAEVMEELFTSFGLAMLTGVVCIFIVLTLLFKDLLHPLTILVSLPLALGGAFVALLAANQSFSMPSLIGLIMLMGIATKNSILLVEYVIAAQRDHGLGRLDALVGACHKRARPIVMTSIAMGAGMLPIAASWGAADPSFRSPMAICVIGGLITSTLLSLLVVPVVYDLLEDARLGFSRWWLHLQARHGGTK